MRIPYSFGMRWLTAAATGGVALWLTVIIGGGALSGTDQSIFNGGWHWQSAAISFWESFVCVGTCLGLIVLFREKFNTQGRFARFLSDNAFAVYVFHPPVLIAVTMGLHAFAGPAIIRFALASALAVVLTFLASEFVLRRIPLLKRVL
jgi:surface polysaccharide O-acyltransferase-like enzyme